MPVRISRQTVPFQTEAVDWISPDDPRYGRFHSYPHPALLRSGSPLTVELQTVQIENEFFRVQVAPSLGGRIISWVDVKTGEELLGTLPKILQVNSERGVELRHGMELALGGFPRQNSLGPVDIDVVEPESESDMGGVLMHELIPSHGLSWHLSVFAKPDDPRLSLECRAIRRQPSGRPCGFGFAIHSTSPSVVHRLGGAVVTSQATHRSWLLEFPEGEFLSAEEWNNATHLIARPSDIDWPPGQTESFVLRISAAPANERIDFVQKGLAGSISHTIKIWPSLPIQNLSVYAKSGELTLKAEVAASYHEPFVGELPLPPTQLILTGTEGRASWPGEDDHPLIACRDQERAPNNRPWAQLRRAALHSKGSDFHSALASIEHSLSNNAENHIAWWALAALSRKLGLDSDAIEQVHALAPLEPLARAEAFLALPQEHGKEPHGLIKPMANDPEAMVDAACLMIWFGFVEDSARWIDECLRHRDVPLLRYLLAHQLWNRMPIETANHIMSAEELPMEPPYPIHEPAIDAVLELAAHFPDSKRLQASAAMANEFRKSLAP